LSSSLGRAVRAQLQAFVKRQWTSGFREDVLLLHELNMQIFKEDPLL
jgi:hypothetical protein